MSGFAGLTIRGVGECRFDLVALGEVMLRFDPGEGQIVNARSFHVWEGGGEYNVARGLRHTFGLRTAVVTALVDNAVGRLVEDLMLQGGVDLSYVQWREFDGVGRACRNGVYFLERGFGERAGMGTMDRGNTAISQMKRGDVDWDAMFGDEGVRWFHTGAVMAAASEESTEVVREAMTAARRHGAVVSFDCNYRDSQWRTRGGRAGSIAVNRSLMPLADVMFGHEGDVAAVMGEASMGPVWHTLESFGEMAERVTAEFGNLKVIASTVRRTQTASRNAWSAFGFAEGRASESLRFDELAILDRVGGGDSFAAGLVYGLLEGEGLKQALDRGVTNGALAMTTTGDNSRARLREQEGCY